MTTKLLALITLLLLSQAYDIVGQCADSGCTPGCSQCNKLQGGPFDVNNCIDPFTCYLLNIPQTLTITCNGCSNGVECSYTNHTGNYTASGCVNDADPGWPSFKQALDQYYHIFNPKATAPYDWCANACKSGFSTGAIIAIVIAGAAVLTIGIVMAVKLCKHKKVETYQKM